MQENESKEPVEAEDFTIDENENYIARIPAGCYRKSE